MQAAALGPASAPEVRRGEPPRPSADVFSLGLLLLQLLTGSEASGLLDYVKSAVSRGGIADVLDPCADCISPATALPLAKLALRHASAPSVLPNSLKKHNSHQLLNVWHLMLLVPSDLI